MPAGAGEELGSIRNSSEVQGMGTPQPYMMKASADPIAAGAVPIEGGELSTSINVHQVTWILPASNGLMGALGACPSLDLGSATPQSPSRSCSARPASGTPQLRDLQVQLPQLVRQCCAQGRKQSAAVILIITSATILMKPRLSGGRPADTPARDDEAERARQRDEHPGSPPRCRRP